MESRTFGESRSFRSRLLVGCALATVSACNGATTVLTDAGPTDATSDVGVAPPAHRATQIASFVGSVDSVANTLRFGVESASGESGRAVQALTEITVGSGTPDTVRLHTISSSYDSDGSGGCGRANSFCGLVTVQSFYTTYDLANVYVEITSITPVESAAYNSVPAAMGLGNTYGLWSYGELNPAGSGGDATTRTWGFNAPSSGRFNFGGRIMADLLMPACGAGQLSCGGVCIAEGVSNCGSCGNSCDDGRACTTDSCDPGTRACRHDAVTPNAAPINTLPPGPTVASPSSPRPFDAATGVIAVADPDSCSVTTDVSRTAGTGTLSVLPSAECANTSATVVHCVGSPAAISAALVGLTFQPVASPSQSIATLTVSTSDGVSLPVINTLDVLVFPSGCTVQRSASHSYVFCSNSLDSIAAEAFCVAGSSHLVALNSSAENDFVAGFFAGAAWNIGLRDELGEGCYGWTDSTGLAGPPSTCGGTGFVSWKPSEPNGGSSENCVIAFPQGSTGLWADVPCTGMSFPTICELPQF